MHVYSRRPLILSLLALFSFIVLLIFLIIQKRQIAERSIFEEEILLSEYIGSQIDFSIGRGSDLEGYFRPLYSSLKERFPELKEMSVVRGREVLFHSDRERSGKKLTADQSGKEIFDRNRRIIDSILRNDEIYKREGADFILRHGKAPYRELEYHRGEDGRDLVSLPFFRGEVCEGSINVEMEYGRRSDFSLPHFLFLVIPLILLILISPFIHLLEKRAIPHSRVILSLLFFSFFIFFFTKISIDGWLKEAHLSKVSFVTELLEGEVIEGAFDDKRLPSSRRNIHLAGIPMRDIIVAEEMLLPKIDVIEDGSPGSKIAKGDVKAPGSLLIYRDPAQCSGAGTLKAIIVAFLYLLISILLYLSIEYRIISKIWRGCRVHGLAYLYILPGMTGMLILVFIPFFYGFGLGFFRREFGELSFAGFHNFFEILNDFRISQPRNFYFTFGVTILWTFLNISLHVTIGLILALMLKDRIPFLTGIWRVLLIIPWAIPNYITALIWKGMFHKEFGAINALLSFFGIEPISWFQRFVTAFSANLITNTWLGFPFMMVVSLGALQSIPKELYEAAEVDGASGWQKFWNITLPLLKPALFPAVILGTIWTFNMFNIIYLVSGGAPNHTTDILITEAYRWAFEGNQMFEYAAAYSTIIFFILLIYTIVTNRLTKATEGIFD